MKGTKLQQVTLYRRKHLSDKEKEQLDSLHYKVDRLERKLDELTTKLEKHIDFIDATYEGLKNPIQAAKRFLGK